MSCEKNSAKAARAAKLNGIPRASGKSGFTAGSTTQAGIYVPPALAKNKKIGDHGSAVATVAKPKTKRPARKVLRPGKNKQAIFFAQVAQKPAGAEQPLPHQRHINVSLAFTPDELSRMSVQLRLGAAAAARHINQLRSGASRGIGHSDTRPADWAQSDLHNYQFLVGQLTEARRGRGYLDTSRLARKELIDLWEFSRFETDRAHRNIDHLSIPGGSIQGETAEYLSGGHKLEARFFEFIANHVETMVPTNELELNLV